MGLGHGPATCARGEAGKQPSLFGALPGDIERRPRALPRRVATERARTPAERHDAILAMDIETVPDADLVPAGWPADKFPKNAWHRIVAISFVVAGIERGPDGTEAYAVEDCRSGGEADWDEARLLRAFWRYFGRRRFRVLTWNGRAFDMPTILARSMMHGLDASPWYRPGTRWESYGHRFAVDWHTDLMDAMSEHGAASRLTLEEASSLIGLPGKLGEHGSCVAEMVARGDLARVRDYCETDCLNLAALYFRWAFLTGRTDSAGHDGAVAGLIGYLDDHRAARPHLGRFLDAWRLSSNHRPPLVARNGDAPPG